jgi:hypothetical protein
MRGTHLFGLPNVLEAGLEPRAAAEVVVAALKFSQCNVLWGSFPQARGLGCRRFDSGWCFISSKCGSNISGRLWSYGAHDTCFGTLVTILDSLQIDF